MFLQGDWQRATSKDSVKVICDALIMIENNALLEPKFYGLPCLSHPDLDLYLDATNLNNIRQSHNLLSSHDGVGVDARIYGVFCQHSVRTVSTLEIANKAKLPFEFVESYANRFEEKGLIEQKPCFKVYETELQMQVA